MEVRGNWQTGKLLSCGSAVLHCPGPPESCVGGMQGGYIAPGCTGRPANQLETAAGDSQPAGQYHVRGTHASQCNLHKHKQHRPVGREIPCFKSLTDLTDCSQHYLCSKQFIAPRKLPASCLALLSLSPPHSSSPPPSIKLTPTFRAPHI